MLVNAMEVSGIEGNYRLTCERGQRLTIATHPIHTYPIDISIFTISHPPNPPSRPTHPNLPPLPAPAG